MDQFILIAERKTQNELLTLVARQIKDVNVQTAKVIVLVGGAASGKSMIASKLKNLLDGAVVLSTDDYLISDRKYRHEHLDNGDPLKKYNAVLLNEHIDKTKNLKSGKSLKVPERDEHTGIALDIGEKNFPKNITGPIEYLIIEGDFQLVKNPDYVIYLDVPDEVRKVNRIERDFKKRNMESREEVEENFELRQKNQHVPYTEPVKKIADMVIEAKTEKQPQGGFSYLYNIYLKKHG